MRSFMKATGKVAVKIVIGTIVKAALSQWLVQSDIFFYLYKLDSTSWY
jgi:hypothetical protein